MGELDLSLTERNLLSCYILATTNHRKDAAEAWDKLAQETNADGTPKYEHAKSNADYYRNLSVRLEAIRLKLDS